MLERNNLVWFERLTPLLCLQKQQGASHLKHNARVPSRKEAEGRLPRQSTLPSPPPSLAIHLAEKSCSLHSNIPLTTSRSDTGARNGSLSAAELSALAGTRPQHFRGARREKVAGWKHWARLDGAGQALGISHIIGSFAFQYRVR